MLVDDNGNQPQPHWFTIEAWVRKDINNDFEDEIGFEVGQIFHKLRAVGGFIQYGISFGDTSVRFHFMNQFAEYDHNIPTGDF